MTDLQPASASTTPDATTGDLPGDAGAAPSRRTVLRMLGVGGAVASVTFMTGCGSFDKGGGASEDTAKVRSAVQQAVAGGKVPVGSGLVLEDVGAVLTQPKKGEYHVFSTYCPHAGGRVTTFEEGTGRPVCVLHGSVFDATTGAVVAGPSPKGLSPIDVPTAGSSTAG